MRIPKGALKRLTDDDIPTEVLRGEARWLPCSSVQPQRDHSRAYVDGVVAVRPRPGPGLCRSAHLWLLVFGRPFW
eukprot:scaffold16006_cov110-Isochrysis_galbana.AAC.5